MKIKNVYFDMDGVLTDFRAHCEKVFLPDPFKHAAFQDWLAHQVYDGTLFEELAPNPHLKEMVSLICDIKMAGYGVGILSSLGNRMPPGQRRLIRQKNDWLKRHDIYDYFDEHFYVPSCDDKVRHARNLNIVPEEGDDAVFYWNTLTHPDKFADNVESINMLIDDRSHLVDQFSRAGGVSYHYDIKRHKTSEGAIRAILNV